MCNLVSTNSHRPQVLFSAFNSIVNPSIGSTCIPSQKLCDRFLSFIVENISQIRSSILTSSIVDPSSYPDCLSSWCQFQPFSLEELSDIVHRLKPSVCPLDVIPPRLFKQAFDSVASAVHRLMNCSLLSGCVPLCFKQAIVNPLLMKPSLDATCLSNYRPISKLSFLSKVLEKVVHAQLQDFLSIHHISDKFQSGFKARHSTESALLRVVNDLLMINDSGKSAALRLLELSAAFDTIDHDILLSRLESCVGIRGTVLDWFQSYLQDKSFSVNLGTFTSPPAPVTCGVPQGSILGPTSFSLYILPLSSIFARHNITFHCFADDLQIYRSLIPDSAVSLMVCLADLKQ
uniref:Reverse transcriptase domain-containing protein n=1 Tax=Nothobranchius furzeri TaxID=105023 RepID=A0A8C6P1G3_NOTFU